MNEIKAAFASMRPTLWIGVSLNVFAASHVLGIDWHAAIYLATCLCLVSGFSFLINDLSDKDIDMANYLSRPQVSSGWTFGVFGLAMAVAVIPALPQYKVVDPPLSIVVIVTLGLAALYSLIFARILLLKNLSAVILATSPLWACLSAAPMPPSPFFLSMIVAFSLYILAREIKFDQFDAHGDRLGGRRTLPHVMSARTIETVVRSLTVAATAMLVLIAYQSISSLATSVIPTGLALAIGFAMYLRIGEKRDIHYTSVTRVAMILSPLYVVSAL